MVVRQAPRFALAGLTNGLFLFTFHEIVRGNLTKGLFSLFALKLGLFGILLPPPQKKTKPTHNEKASAEGGSQTFVGPPDSPSDHQML